MVSESYPPRSAGGDTSQDGGGVSGTSGSGGGLSGSGGDTSEFIMGIRNKLFDSKQIYVNTSLKRWCQLKASGTIQKLEYFETPSNSIEFSWWRQNPNNSARQKRPRKS